MQTLREKRRGKKFRPFGEARAFVRKLKLRTMTAWWVYCREGLPGVEGRPEDIPTNPWRTYKNKGWKDCGDWLGTGAVAPWLRQYRSFEEARAFVRKLKLRTSKEWRVYCAEGLPGVGRCPADIPVTPRVSYRGKGWQSIGDWLGTGSVATYLRSYRRFAEARAFARRLKLRSVMEWRAFCKGEMPERGNLPADIPAAVERVYAGKGWNGWADWVGRKRGWIRKPSSGL